jgi:geranylgeranyl diphosphate synthase type II
MNSYLDLIEAAIKKLQFKGHPKSLYDPANYMMSLGGKRIRPILTLMACKMFDGNIEKAMYPALAMEIFHNFSLVHDDFMDHAPLRRGKATVHTKWDVPTAILSGDLMLVLAYKVLSKSNDEKLADMLRLFNNTAIKVCEGQQLDMEFQHKNNISIQEYLDMIGLKTAALLAGCLKMGAVVAGASTKDAEYIYDFGYKLGISFQIQDDLLDSFGDAQTFGKSIGGDIVENKKTFLAIKARELATPAIRKKLDTLASETDYVRKVELILTIYEQLGIKHITKELSEKYYQDALKDLDSISTSDASKKELISLAEELLNRVR